MSEYASKLVNVIPKMFEKSYLELGVACGETYRNIVAAKKTGVEILPYLQLAPDFVEARPFLKEGSTVLSSTVIQVPTPATHVMTTDEFFKINKEKFDVIFIDACHNYDFVVKDFQNSLSVLNPGGILLVHDLVPRDAFHASEELGAWNGTGYKILAYMIDIHYPFFPLDCDYGLTVFFDPALINFPKFVKDINYNSFCERISRIKRYSVQELSAIISNYWL